jgi:hypothetical protein
VFEEALIVGAAQTCVDGFLNRRSADVSRKTVVERAY